MATQQLSHLAFPPHRILSPARPISAADALSRIQSYLSRADDDASLHPDAQFSRREGPQVARHASEGGLVLQLLRRVERGLAGERIAAEAPGREYGIDGAAAEVDDIKIEADLNGATEGGQFEEQNYMQQMTEEGFGGITEGEIGSRSNFVRDVGVDEAARRDRKRKLDHVDVTGSTSKEERRRLKKERQAAEKRQKYEANAQRNRAEQDIDMTEVPEPRAGEDADEAMENGQVMDTVVQNAPATVGEDKQNDKEASRRRKQERREHKKQVAAAARELEEGDGGGDEQQAQEPPVVDDRAGERGTASEVVDRFGRDAETPGGPEERRRAKKERRKDKHKA